ncbi:hypothetical protein G7Y31_06665 [Corynebacterium lizhenjunii]|uniref:Uncharacterized protein n=1 Tax=Corynebacterium lizhenjunii TaxID=2709394 RepID=A0A7T0PB13_9CORY|nr:hypothetical protein [Corynebacterium lizhenjunii]QPK78267.1 hypothetical protein G7Y31_06665 [Corynebacterium lizhenjunii]
MVEVSIQDLAAPDKVRGIEFPAGAGLQILDGCLVVLDGQKVGLAAFAAGRWLSAELR